MKDKKDVKNFNFIGTNTLLNGNLAFQGNTYFHGALEGNIHQEDQETLVCEVTSHIKGDIIGTNVEIYGEIEGTIHAQESLIIYPTAKVTGNIKAKNFKIYAGANFNGEMNTTRPEL